MDLQYWGNAFIYNLQLIILAFIQDVKPDYKYKWWSSCRIMRIDLKILKTVIFLSTPIYSKVLNLNQRRTFQEQNCSNGRTTKFDSKWYHRISKEQSHEEDIWLKFLSFDLTNKFLRNPKVSSNSKSSLLRLILKLEIQERNKYLQRNDIIQRVTNVLKGLRIQIIYIKHFL